ncbi:MAG: amidophosphoribosyltransferase [Candidatus Omnitrophica bacterium CG11_big_fil_rev_8_21_14_0_20_63_9]|nr:MAG: amidophosphoribosyltransferase [Candidatus Omnitrophica bacterium CG11_big_fil_rev_8_21_14_0_20_63_9]
MQILHALSDLLYPPACLRCRAPLTRGGHIFCRACRAAMPKVGAPMCRRCGAPVAAAFDAQVDCATCRRRPPAFAIARARRSYTGPTAEIIQGFKYRRRWRIGRWLSRDMAACARAALPLQEIDLVVPVPLHWLKRRMAGFDHAGQLARDTARRLRLPHDPRALRRRRWTSTQTRLPAPARFRNVRAAFAADPRRVAHRTVLLVDDVLTSGATADACAQVLAATGARRVIVLTAARTPRA